MQLKYKGKVIAEGDEKLFVDLPGVQVMKPEGAEAYAEVTDETAFLACLQKEYHTAYTTDTSGFAADILANHSARMQQLIDTASKLDCVNVYDADDNIIDFCKPDDTGHLNYEPVKSDAGAVTHFIVKAVEHAEVKTYSVLDYKENVVASVTEEEGLTNELLTPVYDDGELQCFNKMPEFIFKCAPVIGQVRIAAKDQAEAWEKLGNKTLKDYINRDNTALSFIQ